MGEKNQILKPNFVNLDCILNLNSKNLIAKNLYVPKFQRNYSWEDKEVVQLLNDIFENFEKNEDYYFIGTIQLTDFNGNNEYAIIDGQQRLTTLLLIIKCLTNKIEELNYEIINIDIKNDAIYKRYYDKVFVNDSINTGLSDNNLYYKNYQIIEKYLNEKDDNKNNDSYEKELLNYILEKLYVIVILSERQPLSKIIKIFDTLNTTGMDLNSGNKVNNKMYVSAKKFM